MACCACCENPGYQNCNRWVLFALSVLVWIFSIVAVANCKFWKFDEDSNGVGLFKFENFDGSCKKYPSGSDYSSSHEVGRAFGVLATLATSFAMLGIASIIFFLEKGKGATIVWTVTRVLYVLALLCTLVMFAFLKDCFDNDPDNTCHLGAAGIINVLNVFIILGVSITSCCTPIPPEPMFHLNCSGDSYNNKKADEEQTKDVEEPATSDSYPKGSVVKRTVEITPKGRKITEEVVQPDGSKIITETVEVNTDM